MAVTKVTISVFNALTDLQWRAPMSARLLDRAGLKSKGINWNPSTLWRKRESFPKPVIVGNKNMWVEAEVDAYIENLIAKRDEADAPVAA
jgi:hypothetical protein